MDESANPFEYKPTTKQKNGGKVTPKELPFAYACGLTPLVVGSAIYVCWRFTAWPWLQVAGIWTFFIGMFFFVFGLAAWWKARSKVYRLGVGERGGLPGRTGLALIVLLANWPVAFWIIGDAAGNGQHTAVTIENKTSEALTDVSFLWASTRGNLGTIAAGGTTTRECRVSFFHSAVVYIDATRGSLKSEFMASLWGEDRLAPVTVTFRDDGSVVLGETKLVEQKSTQHIDIDPSKKDELIVSYGHLGGGDVMVERVTNGKTQWLEYADPIGTSYDDYIQEARISIDGNEFDLNCLGTAGKFHERRDLESGKLLERTEDLADLTKSPDDQSHSSETSE